MFFGRQVVGDINVALRFSPEGALPHERGLANFVPKLTFVS